jgi:hypothetical protein
MYPDDALPEFYPHWLIAEASARVPKELPYWERIDAIHAFATPVMYEMSKGSYGLQDLGFEWFCKNYAPLTSPKATANPETEQPPQ